MIPFKVPNMLSVGFFCSGCSLNDDDDDDDDADDGEVRDWTHLDGKSCSVTGLVPKLLFQVHDPNQLPRE